MLRKHQNQIIFLLLLWLQGNPCQLYSQEPSISIDQTFYENILQEWIPIQENISYQQNLLSDFIPSQMAFDSTWKPLTGNTPTWNNNLWLKLPIENKMSEVADLTLLLHVDKLDVWYQKENQEWVHQKGGKIRPRSDWDSRQKEPVYLSPHTIQFAVAAQQKYNLFICIGAMDHPQNIQPQLCNRPYFISHSAAYFQRTIASQSFFHGILLLMVLFTLGMFIMNKNKAYLFYAVYTFSIAVNLFYAFEFYFFSFLAEYPIFGRGIFNASKYAFIFFYLLFLQYFLHQEDWRLDLKKKMVFYHKMILIVGLLTTLALWIIPYNIFSISMAGWIYLPFSMLGLWGLLWISWQYWTSNHRLAQFVAANNLFMLLGLTLSGTVFYASSLGLWNGREAAYWGILFLEGTIVLQLLSFSLSLSYKGLETERERVKFKELDRLKSRFFANISHEFRTPLTLILGPVQELQQQAIQPKQKELLNISEKYAKNLLRLVNQILDLTKLEVGKMEKESHVFDWMKMVKVITFSFESLAQQKQIQLEVSHQQEKQDVYLDQNKMEQVLINLLSNAIKYTPEGGRIQVQSNISIDEKSLELTVEDNGVGISEEQQKFIFQHFYQADHPDYIVDAPSSGIGLSLCKELVELHDGKIQVISRRKKGTKFIVTIPLPSVEEQMELSATNASNHFIPASENPLSTAKTDTSNDKNLPTILIVEDHPDIQQYIQSCLANSYHLLLAKDGEDGYNKAIAQVPDLIISDVMMPKKDGITLTKELKSHIATSHIPIIILTGKSSKESKIEGLLSAADDYLTKPFDADELRIRIKNILDNRQKWIQHFQKNTKEINTDIIPALESREDKFLQKISKIVEENLGDENFSVEKLGRAINLDRTQLFRKLKATTGENPSKFIRTIRLKKAYTLLANRTATVGEIAFSVGFASTTYFNRCFKEQFGKTPGTVLNG